MGRNRLPLRLTAPRLLAVLCAALAAAGCIPGVNAPLPTATPDRTLEAIPVMLTGTARAPTITLTPVRSATPTATPTRTPTPTPYPDHPDLPGRLGEVMDTTGGSEGALFTVLGVEEPAAIPGIKAREGQHYIEFDVLVENPTGEAQEYNRLFFRLAAPENTFLPPSDEEPLAEPAGAGEEPEGLIYEPLAAATGPMLLSGRLLPGEWVRGRVAFAASEDAADLWLRYRHDPASADIWIDPTRRTAGSPGVPETGALAAGLEDLPGTGERVSSSGITLLIDNTTMSETFERIRAAKGSDFFILDVTITNDARAQAPFNAVYFRLKDGSGFEYVPVVLPSDALIIAGSLGRGQRVSGKVIFELPEDVRPSAAAPMVVKYRPQVLVDEYEEMRVRVGD